MVRAVVPRHLTVWTDIYMYLSVWLGPREVKFLALEALTTNVSVHSDR